jgi:hypothetical protein
LHVDNISTTEVDQRLTEYYSAKNILKHNAIELESLA